MDSLKDLPSQKEIEELLSDTKDKNKNDLYSVSKGFARTGLPIPYQQDEQENKKIKDNLRSFPTTVEFLEKDKPEKPDSV